MTTLAPERGAGPTTGTAGPVPGAAAVAVLTAISPFDVARPPEGWTALHLRPLLLVTAGLALWALTRRPLAIDRPLVAATGVLVAGFAIASLASVDPATGFAVTARVAVLGLVLLASATVVRGPAERRLLAVGVAVGAAGAAVVGLAVLAAGSDRLGTDVLVGSISVTRGVTRLTRPFSHANVAAMYLAPAAVLLAGSVTGVRRRRMALLVGAAALAAVALSLTFSRGGLAAVLVGTAVVAVAGGRDEDRGPARDRPSSAWVPSARVPVALAVAGLAVGVGLASGRWASRLGPATATDGGPVAPSRSTIWGQAVDVWLDAPLVGVGPGRFGTHTRSLTPAGDAVVAHAHNPVLEAAATGGLVALAGVAVLAVTVLVRAGRGWSMVPVGLSAALVAAILPMVVDHPFAFSSSGNLAAVVAGAWIGGASVGGSRGLNR